jgi:hypothetical protein
MIQREYHLGQEMNVQTEVAEVAAGSGALEELDFSSLKASAGEYQTRDLFGRIRSTLEDIEDLPIAKDNRVSAQRCATDILDNIKVFERERDRTREIEEKISNLGRSYTMRPEEYNRQRADLTGDRGQSRRVRDRLVEEIESEWKRFTSLMIEEGPNEDEQETQREEAGEERPEQ